MKNTPTMITQASSPDSDHLARPLYKMVKLFNVVLFKRCKANDANSLLKADMHCTYDYPVTYLNENTTVLTSQPVIIKPDGTLWREGTLFLLRKVIEEDKDPTTLISMASHLTEFMNTLEEEGRNFLDFSGYRFELPTYIFKEKFNVPIKRHLMGVGTANLKIRTVIKFYTDLMESRNFVPETEPWRVKKTKINYEDSFGYERTKYITYTDLTYPNIAKDPFGEFIRDDGRLIPLTKAEQTALLESLILVDNPEMILIFIIALTTGMRIQTILTLRIQSILIGNAYRFDLIPVRAGAGSLVDSKRNKPLVVMVPAWLHHKIYTYINSERYRQRVALASSKPHAEQYVFLSRTGTPYYIAKADVGLFKSNERGSYIRGFIKNLIKPLMSQKGFDLNFSFHDLRATFGMNLLHEREDMLNRGLINRMELIDYIRQRMHHKSAETTEQYLNFRRNKELIYQADTEYQQYLINMFDKGKQEDA